ncbi:MAG TPA: hypothetical protein VEH04_10500 [Verrucomicrobiae bacterium]|nr:hypothetical protein [Verrucomicrobiae bacterium]
MKTNMLILIAALAGGSAFAQTSDAHSTTAPTGSRFDSTPSESTQYSVSEIASQLHELQRTIEETLPMLQGVTQSGTNSASQGQTTTAGAIAGILGSVLNRTNDTAGSETPRTNAWGNILRGVLGSNTNQTASANATTTLNDLTSLREHLQAIAPLLDRLESKDLSAAIKGEDENLTPTGRDSE